MINKASETYAIVGNWNSLLQKQVAGGVPSKFSVSISHGCDQMNHSDIGEVTPVNSGGLISYFPQEHRPVIASTGEYPPVWTEPDT